MSDWDTASRKADAAGEGLSGLTDSSSSSMGLASYKKGGKVERTGPAKLHKGERVLNRKQTKKYDRKRGGKK